ncbi:hypothetical protein LguiA_014506 [Lonicera macranthoides]
MNGNDHIGIGVVIRDHRWRGVLCRDEYVGRRMESTEREGGVCGSLRGSILRH